MNRERLEILIDRYFDQLLSADEKAELEQMLLESASAREQFWELARWHGALRQLAQEEWGRRDAAATTAPNLRVMPAPQPRAVAKPRVVHAQATPHANARWWIPLAAAALVMLGFIGGLRLSQNNLEPAEFPAPTKGIAVLSHASSAIWADENPAHQNGEVLNAGSLKLKAGALQIEFTRGARVVVEGPAEIELLTDNSCALQSGKLVATVPEPAHGFKVRARDFSVIDYGTQFGCAIPLTGSPEVHVFRGAVGVETSASVKTELRENNAVRVNGSQLQQIPANPDAFLTEEKLTLLDKDNARARLAAWRESSAAFSRHKGMLVHFDFENNGEADHTLVNRAVNAASQTNGSIIGCEWAQGRWPGKGALEFKRGDDCVRLAVPGEFRAMTLVAWVRADSLPFGENSLVMADDRAQLGEANWYLFRDGSLGWSARVAARGAREQWHHVHSTPLFRSALGSWRLVATVFDGSTVTHYFDGKNAGSELARLPTPLHFGPLEIGNSTRAFANNEPTDRANVGNFFGRIDELAILSVPLNAAEIAELYEHGRTGEQ